MSHQPDDLMTTAEVAAMARVSSKTVLVWNDSGALLEAMRLPGGGRRFHRSDVEALLAPTNPAPSDAA